MSPPKVPPSVGAVVVNFNGGEKVVRCIEALRAQTVGFERVVVVDNGSTDDSVSRIGASAPETLIIALGENRGLPFARNVGLGELNTDLVLSVDADLYLAPDGLERLIAAQRRHGVAAVCPRILLYPQRSVVQCDGAGLHFLGTLALRHAYQAAEGLPAEGGFVGACTGGCMLLDRARVVEAGGFDELFFFYFEDLEFCLRLRAQGHRVYWEPGATGHHDLGKGTAGLAFRGGGDRYPTRRAYLTMRHRWLAILIHYHWRTLIVLSPALALYELATVGLSLARGWLPAWGRAWWWLIRHGRVIRERRQRAQAARTTADREILEGGPIPLAPGLLQSGLARRLVNALSLILNGYWRMAQKAIG